MFEGSRPKVHFGHSLGLQSLNQNPVSHSSSIGTVKCDTDQVEATGIGSASWIFPDGRCRIPFPDLRTEPTPNPRWPSRRDAAEPLRYRARARKLTPDQEASIRALTGIKSVFQNSIASASAADCYLRITLRGAEDAHSHQPSDENRTPVMKRALRRSAHWPPSSGSAMRRSGPRRDRTARQPDERSSLVLSGSHGRKADAMVRWVSPLSRTEKTGKTGKD